MQAIINYARIKNKLPYELSAKYNSSGFIVRRGYFWQDDFLRGKDSKIMHKPKFFQNAQPAPSSLLKKKVLTLTLFAQSAENKMHASRLKLCVVYTLSDFSYADEHCRVGV